MSSPINAELQEELDRMRTIIGQYRQTEIEMADSLLQSNTLVNTLTIRVEELERENILRSPLSTPHSPIPAHNLQPAMTAVAPMDGAIVQQIVDTSIASLETKIMNFLAQHLQQSNPEPTPASTPLGAASGLSGPPQSPSNTISNVSGGALGNTKKSLNDYDKAVEVEQRKLSDPVLTPPAIRTWKLSYDVYAKDPNRRMSMYEAFGTQSMRSLMIMFPDEPIPMDDSNFELYINKKILTTTNLFSDIKLAVAKNAMEKDKPLTVESLYLYLAGFCTSLSPFSEEMALRNSSPDLHKTIITAFYDGIIHVSFRKKLEETSCSTWQAARQNFQECLTPTNVQLAIAQNRAFFKDNPRPHYDKPDYEGKKAKSLRKSKETTLDLVPHVPTDNKKKPAIRSQLKSVDTVLSGIAPQILAPCKNCRKEDHLTFDCPIPMCYDCRDNDETYDHLQSQCVHRIWKENKIAKLARQAARHVIDASAFEDSDDYYTDDNT